MTFCTFTRGRKPEPAPDPGKYNIPSTFGQGPRFSMRGRHKELKRDYNPEYNILPSTLSKNGVSLGAKSVPKFKKRNIQTTPGPYYIPSTIGEGPKVYVHKKFSRETEVTPGPGQYTAPSLPKGPAYSCGVGRRFDFIVDNILVAPGTYDIPSTVQGSRTKIIHSPGKPKYVKQQHPGPIYNVSGKTGADARHSSFSKAPRFPEIEETPGPADYCQLSDPIDRHRVATALHGRTREPQLERPDPPYYEIPTTIVPRKKSMASRPATSYDTISPGPIYETKPAIEYRKITVGNKFELKDPRADYPSPDAYNIGGFGSQSQFISQVGMRLGGAPRDIINEAEAASLPGPASYEPPESEFSENGRKGFTLKSRHIGEEKPDNDAPLYNVPSALGGPSFTIGIRDF